MKDELGRRIMMEFMELRLKLYTFKMLSGSGGKKCKGVKKCVVKKMLLAGRKAFRKQLLFQNKLHEVHVVEMKE